MVYPNLLSNNVRAIFVENKTMAARDLPRLNDDVLYVLLSKVVELEEIEMT